MKRQCPQKVNPRTPVQILTLLFVNNHVSDAIWHIWPASIIWYMFGAADFKHSLNTSGPIKSWWNIHDKEERIRKQQQQIVSGMSTTQTVYPPEKTHSRLQTELKKQECVTLLWLGVQAWTSVRPNNKKTSFFGRWRRSLSQMMKMHQ